VELSLPSVVNTQTQKRSEVTDARLAMQNYSRAKLNFTPVAVGLLFMRQLLMTQ
jgi:hypothetical protein